MHVRRRSGGRFRKLGPAVALASCLAALAGLGCRESPRRDPAKEAAPADSIAPPTRQRLPTTDGTIALDNLSAQIVGAEARVKRRPHDASSKQMLANLVSIRGRYLSRIADYEYADKLAEEAVADEPQSPAGYLARSSARAGMHRFEEALADLDEAERLGTKPALTRGARASILQGQGDLDGALALRKADREAKPTIMTLGTEGALLGELGRYDEAAERFQRALDSYHDVSAPAVAWLLFQEGLIWEKAGKTARAKAFFTAAHERLPGYAHAASHLAVLLPPAEGAALLAPYVTTSDDPEIEQVLAERMRAAGDATGAARHTEHARARYDELVAKHPAAFAEHAGYFWLDQRGGAKKALELARQNLAFRTTESAYRLALLAAIAAGDHDEACKTGESALQLPHTSEMLRAIAADACKKR